MNPQVGAVHPAGPLARRRITVRGLVQGVGFRPQVYRTAAALQLAGWVRNDGDGVTIEVEGAQIDAFLPALRESLPVLARIDSVEQHPLAASGERGFRIEASERGSGSAGVPADVAICSACLQELFDPGNRRYLHPFIACCDCGPRYSMARQLPYDRGNTAMADFELCADCAADYRDPLGRRLHAEPIACHRCGPTLSHPVDDIAAALRAGQIVALKGVGGYHLACDARSPAAVQRLRERKRRDGRPFAVMLLNVASAGRQVQLDAAARTLLADRRRPVLVADRAPGFDLPETLAPGLGTLGVMLPYTPLHYLVFHALLDRPAGAGWLGARTDVALVMTSANRSGDPMLADDAQADALLGPIADLVVSHSRCIEHPCDDSVLRAMPEGPVMVRRGRGYAPTAIPLATRRPAVLALGAHLKSTVCALRGREAVLSAHIGDLGSPATQALLARSASELRDWLKLRPRAVACDLHPDYASSRLAQRLAEALEVPLLPVQHHHAHIAAVAAAHGVTGPLLGLALDGHGMGADGGNWGGELLRVDGAACERLGHLRPLSLPGGDRAAREPWRIALAVAASLGREAVYRERLGSEPLCDGVLLLARSGNCPSTTAAGRYFDAAAALLGICPRAAFEAAGPMMLEGLCRELRADPGLFHGELRCLDLSLLLTRLLDVDDPAAGSALFHGTLVEALAGWVSRAAEATGLRTVALGGGCFLNAVLARELPGRLRATGLRVLQARGEVTPGDGGISLGQAWVAAEQLASSTDVDGAQRGQVPWVDRDLPPAGLVSMESG